jgi:thioester reductase-like protein
MDTTNIYNLYSISECHDVAVYKLHKNDKVLEQEGVVPVGHVLPMVDAIILDNDKQPVAHGEKGELYIHSIGLANEYINRPDLNAERFIEAKDSPIGKRLYKTGDYSKLSQDGKLISIYGRCDYIVKLRGYTLSLPFIESIIKDKIDIMHCIVDKVGETRMSESLVAYLEIPEHKQESFYKKWELSNNKKLSKKLLNAISPHLAHYMVPSHIVIVNKISLNKYSNKLDRNLLNIDKDIPKDIEINEIKTINDYKNLWSNTLDIPPNEIADNNCFFELGGASLQTMLLISQLKNFGFSNIKITDFVKNSTLEKSYSFLTNSSIDDSKESEQIILDDINTLFSNLKPRKNDVLLSQTQNVMITGATGFLGTHILKELISNPQINNIYCVVRATDNQEAKQRIENTLNRINQPISDKIIYIKGDTSKKHFGWDTDTWNKYTKEVDTVIHAAASVNLLLPYSALKTSNLDGTANVVNFCLTSSHKHLVYVSTNGIYPFCTNNTFNESKDVDWLELLDSGYSQTKWAAEKLVHKACDIGLQSTILRLGNISPEYSSYINESDTNWLVLQEILAQKKIPNSINLEMTPIKHISNLIMNILQGHTTDNDVYNITNKYYLNAETLADTLAYEIIDTKLWLTDITNESVKYLVDDENNINSSTDKYDRTNYENLMAKTNSNYPKITKEYINKVFLRK